MFYKLARPFLFSLDAEAAHDLTLKALQRGHDLGIVRRVAESVDPLPLSIMGLRFSNPVGLAAGLDKTAAHIDALGAFGFGFIEAGTVTPRPQSGNAKPRLFRLPESQALINRLGFNNEGAEQFIANLQQQRAFRDQGGVVGLNIGKNADTPIEHALDDYCTCLRRVYDDADYVAVNVSSPNTEGLRSLQSARQLAGLLSGLTEERKRLEDRHGKRVPIAVKIAPDITDESVAEIADQLVAHGMDAVIATNTTIARDSVSGLKHAEESGGLSGRPLTKRATDVVHLLAHHLRGELPIIGVGGIMSGADAVEKISAGASLVQLYTGFVYSGPQLVAECVEAIRKSECVASSQPGP
ncbi:MAG TPA: quinone-dependent dihydroorotate dehydrogenase, partial [Burkholderiaceae bacterium]|nr:quinone-dependent dihydroorotate dehydrogenase [Burkholderiaceae bacterium]